MSFVYLLKAFSDSNKVMGWVGSPRASTKSTRLTNRPFTIYKRNQYLALPGKGTETYLLAGRNRVGEGIDAHMHHHGMPAIDVINVCSIRCVELMNEGGFVC